MLDLSLAVQETLGIQLTSAQLLAFERYEAELIKWNERFNLTAITTPEQIRTKHFLDSLSCLLAMGNPSSTKVIDIGSGAGFPGLPLKIVYPSIQLTLVESVGKKAEFCRHMASVLELTGVEIIQSRAEEVGQVTAHRQQYDWALARAVATLPVLLEYLLPLVRIGGHALAMKGDSAPDEIQSASRAVALLGGALPDLIPVRLPQVPEARYLVVIEKKSSTPHTYPRRVGVPAKKPL